jgi:enterochelin esterase-like enzyme
MNTLVLGPLFAFATLIVAQQVTTAPCKHTVTGQLEVFPFESKVFGNTRMLRVWLPHGYDAANSTKRYPVLYMFDGQGLFDSCTAPGGTEWQVDETLTRLIREGKIDPIIVVGIDSAGDRFLNEYLPWRDVIQGLPQQGQPDGVRMPEFMLREVMPIIEAKYRIAKGAENTGIGGSSAGAVAAVYVTLQAPGTFGKLLAESSSHGLATDSLCAIPRTLQKDPNVLGLDSVDERRTIPVCI